MKRIVYLFILILCILIPVSTLAEPEESAPEISFDEGIESWMEELNLPKWQDRLSELPGEVRSMFGISSVKDFIRGYAEEGSVGRDSGFIGLKQWMLSLFRSGLNSLSYFLSLALLSGLLQGVSGKDSVGGGEAAGFFLRCLALLGALTLYVQAAGELWKVMEKSAEFLEVAFPALLLLLTAVGGTASSTALQPAALLLSGTIAGGIRSVIMPLALLGGISGMLDKLFSKSRMQELSKLLTKTAKWMMGIVSTIFIGSTSIRGLAAASFDSVTLRSAKYAAGSLLPVVGGMVSGTMDTMLGCAVLVKSGAGIAAFLIICATVLTPLAKAACTVLIFRTAAAFSQPLGDGRLSALAAAAADGMSLLMGITIGASLVFLSLITILILIGNAGL